MKIAVTSSGTTLDSPVDPRFGRAACLIVVDTRLDTFEVHENARDGEVAEGRGFQAAETATRLGAEAVITGQCDPVAFRALRAAGIQVIVGAQGTVREAIAGFNQGGLTPLKSFDIEGYWA